jgi:phage-related protein
MTFDMKKGALKRVLGREARKFYTPAALQRRMVFVQSMDVSQVLVLDRTPSLMPIWV